MKDHRTVSMFLLLFSMTLLSSCGGNETYSSGSEAGVLQGLDSSSAGSGSVTLLLTDGPTEQFDHIYLTITGITLIGDDDDQISLFRGEERVDLLSLRNFSEVFSMADEVPAGTYSKIRLFINDIELVTDDELGEVASIIHPKLPANGKIDLKPKAEFTIADGSNTIITIDIDAGKSIKIHKSGKNKNNAEPRYKFRPVVFVKIETEQQLDQGRLVKINGEISDINLIDNTFQLCTLMEVQNVCYEVLVDNDTSIFDTDPKLINVDALENGATATVSGSVSYHNTLNMQLSVNAAVIEMGNVGSFAFLSGIAASDFDETTKSFVLTIEDNQGFEIGSEIVVALLDGTQLYNQMGEPISAEDLKMGARLNVSGIISLAEFDTLKATLIFSNVDDGKTRFSGAILDINSVLGTFNIAQVFDNLCVISNNNALSVFMVTDEQSKEIAFGKLENDMTVDVYGTVNEAGCVVADIIIAFTSNDDDGDDDDDDGDDDDGDDDDDDDDNDHDHDHDHDDRRM